MQGNINLQAVFLYLIGWIVITLVSILVYSLYAGGVKAFNNRFNRRKSKVSIIIFKFSRFVAYPSNVGALISGIIGVAVSIYMLATKMIDPLTFSVLTILSSSFISLGATMSVYSEQKINSVEQMKIPEDISATLEQNLIDTITSSMIENINTKHFQNKLAKNLNKEVLNPKVINDVIWELSQDPDFQDKVASSISISSEKIEESIAKQFSERITLKN